MNDQVTREETHLLLDLAKKCLSVKGDFVELGCYRGDTSVLLGKLLQESARSSEAKQKPASGLTSVQAVESCGKPVENQWTSPENLCKTAKSTVEKPCKTLRHLWIYDSFAGLPEKTREDASGVGANFQAGQLMITKHEVVSKIRRAGLANVIVKKAWFDQLTPADLPENIAFAFLDGDFYSSIKTSLKLVAPRLARQGIMVVHDYNNPSLPGSSCAVDEFLRAHPEYQLSNQYSLAILSKR